MGFSGYRPQPAPINPVNLEAVTLWLEEELRRISATVEEAQILQLTPLYAEPEHIEEGFVVNADGTSWDPGSGPGLYLRRNNAWEPV